MSLYKRAAVRGIVHELVRRGLASFPTKEAADAVADSVADAAVNMPDVAPEGGHDPEQVLEVAQKLREIADQLMAQVGAGQVPGVTPEAGAAGAEELGKTSASMDVETAAYYAAADALDKIASEEMAKQANPQGALVGPGQEHHNTPAAAAKTDSVAAMDEKHRPQGTHQVPRGQTDLPSQQVGELKKNPQQPANQPSGGNSLTEDVHKTSSIVELARKVANALIGQPGAHANTPAAAAQVDTVAKLDQQQRPEGYAHVGQGNANFSEDAAARVGKEEKHPNAPAKIPGTNSVQEASKTSAEDAFEMIFRKTAEEVGPLLPSSLDPAQKTAAIRQMMGLLPAEREGYVAELKKMAEKCDDKKDDDKKDGDKKDGEGKDKGDLMARLHAIANPEKK